MFFFNKLESNLKELKLTLEEIEKRKVQVQDVASESYMNFIKFGVLLGIIIILLFIVV